MSFRKAVLHAVRSLEPNYRIFGTIQSRLASEYSDIAPGKGGKIIRRYDEAQLYDELVRIKDSEGVRLNSERLRGRLELEGLDMRMREALGDACSQLPYIDERVGDGTYRTVSLLGGGERYVFLLSNYRETRVAEHITDPPCVVKPYQRPTEKVVAPLAASVGIGPTVFGLGESWFVEEYLNGKPLESFQSGQFVAYNLGRLFGKMHGAGIECNHSHFADEIRWHPRSRRLKMVDFGVAELGNDFSEDYRDLGILLRKYGMNDTARKTFFDEYGRYSGLDSREKIEF
jgi:hypothetical protein